MDPSLWWVLFYTLPFSRKRGETAENTGLAKRSLKGVLNLGSKVAKGESEPGAADLFASDRASLNVTLALAARFHPMGTLAATSSESDSAK